MYRSVSKEVVGWQKKKEFFSLKGKGVGWTGDIIM